MIFITSLGKIRGRHTSLKIGRTMSYVLIIGGYFAVHVLRIIFHGLLVPFPRVVNIVYIFGCCALHKCFKR